MRWPTSFIGRAAALVFTIGLGTGQAHAEGSATLYPATYPATGAYPAGGFRANLDVASSDAYLGIVRRQQFLYVYARAGEYIALGSRNRSSGGDVLVFDPQDFGQRGDETVPATADFSCATGAIGGAPGTHYFGAGRGTIASRAEELAGPHAIDGSVLVPNGFSPCAYRAPVAGIYGVRFTAATSGSGPDGSVDTPTVSNNTVSAWDVSVRDDATATVNRDGRLFTYAWAAFTGGNSRSIHTRLYYVTADGYRYEQSTHGLDPNGFALYANAAGFLDQGSPLYKDLRGSNQTLQFLRPEGITGVSAQRPQYPVFFADVRDGGPNEIEVERTLAALGIPLAPTPPQVTAVGFQGNLGGATSTMSAGGTFSFTTANTLTYQIVISRDGVDFDPANVLNRVITGAALTGTHTSLWDGNDNNGQPFPPGDYPFELSGRNGEVHFPLIDSEGNPNGGPSVIKLNGPSAGDGTVYYDDRGYVTRSGFNVGTLNGHLCGGMPHQSPQPVATHSLVGVDSTVGGPTTFSRRWSGNGNSNSDCGNSAANTGFGDAKGLDLWAFESVTPTRQEIEIVAPSAGVDVGTLASVSATVLPGDTAYGTFVFSNNGDTAATGVTYGVTIGNPLDPATCPAAVNVTLLPPGVTALYSPAPLCSIAFTGMPATLAPGETYTFNFNYVVALTNPGPIPLATSIDATNETPGAPSPNTAQAATTVPAIDAVDDDFTGTPVSPGGGTTPSVFGNDTLDGADFDAGDVILTLLDDGGLDGATFNADGTINVPPGTAEGLYTLTYRICSLATPTLCDTATVQVLVAATSDPLVCDGTFYQVREPGGGSRLYALDRSADPYTSVLLYNSGVTLNAMGYNGNDNHLYALLNPTTASNALYRLGATALVDLNGAAAGVSLPVAGLPAAAYDGGAFDGAGRYFVSRGTGPMYRIDGIEGAAPAPVATAVGVSADPTPPAGYTGIATFSIGDIAVRPGESAGTASVIYGLRQAEAGVVYLYRFAIADAGNAAPTAAVSRIATDLPSTTFGSVFFDPSGTFYVYDNSASAAAGFYTVDVATGDSTSVSGAESVNSSDGGSCAFTSQSIDVVKAAGAVNVIDATTFRIPYTLVVGNLGTTPVPNAQVSDALALTFAAGAPTLAITAGPSVTGPCSVNPGFDGVADVALLAGTDTLAPGDSCTITFTVEVAYAAVADIPLGAQQNTAYASSTGGAGPNPGYSFPGGTPVPPVGLIAADVSSDAPALPPGGPGSDIPAPTPVLLPAPRLGLVKTSDTAMLTAPATITYSFAATNLGNVDLTLPGINDALCDTAPAYVSGDNGDGVMQPGETFVFTCPHAVTQAEFDAGSLVNTATATATPPGGGTPIQSPPDSTTTTFTAAPGLALDKTSDSATVTALPATIAYTFAVSNTGNVSLGMPTINDALCDAAAGYVSGDANTNGRLDLSETFVFTCSHAVTQAEFEAGSLLNTATASATPPGGGAPIESPPDSTTTTFTATPGIALDKTSDSANITALPATIVYTFAVTNTGNVSLGTPTIVDALCDAPATYVSGDGNGDGRLDLAETFVFTCSHAVTQAEFEDGSLVNTATATGTPPGGGGPIGSPPDSTTTTFVAAPAMTLDKTSDSATIAALPATIAYTFAVANSGNVSLGMPTINDALCDAPASYVSGDTNTNGRLDLTETFVFTCSHALTQAEFDAGSLLNTATASATPPGGGEPIESPPDSTTTQFVATPALVLEKTSDSANIAALPATIVYTFAVTNTGNVTLDAPTIVDALCDAPAVYVSGDANADGRLDLTETFVFTCNHAVTQAEFEAGTLVNTATATAIPPGGGTPIDSPPDSTTTTFTAAPGITVEKTRTDSVDPIVEGSVLAYRIVATNTGNVALDNVTVVDALLPGMTCVPALPTTLAVDASVICTGSYTVTQGDVDDGEVVNTATASGTPPGGDPVGDGDDVITPIPPLPALAVTKTADLADDNGNGSADAGETITYAVRVRNTGNVTLTGLVVDDPMAGGALQCAPTTLAPQAEATCDSYTYTVTAEDIDAGTPILNTATATALPPGGTPPVEDEDTTSTPVGDAVADLAIEKVGLARTQPGQQVAFTIVVTNLGPNTAIDTVLTDPTPDGLQFVSTGGACTAAFPCNLGDLGVGDSRTVIATYLVPSDYVGPDTIVNIASVSSDTPDPTPGDTTSTASTVVGPSVPPVVAPAVIPVDARWAMLSTLLLLLFGGGYALRRRG